MKKYILSLAAGLVACTLWGQTEPNRVIINNADGTSRSLMAERIESVTFGTVEGEVKVTAEVLSCNVADHQIEVSITPTESCVGWKFAIIPEIELNIYNTDARLASYIEANCQLTYTTDQTWGILDIPQLMSGGKYAFCTVGVDRYETLCGVTVTLFETDRNVAGKPAVDVSFSNITETSFDATLTPNADCSRYCYTMYPENELESMYEFYASSFGATSIEDFLANYLSYVSFSDVEYKSYTGLERARTYEIYVVAFDQNGEMCPMQKSRVMTAGIAEGDAKVSIAQGEFTLMQQPNPDNMLEIIYVPYQAFVFTPNDATAKYRAEAFSEAEYEAMGAEKAKEMVMREAETGVPDDMWFRYGERTMRWRFDPGQTGYVLAAGKNGKGEWGEVTVLRFTTPDQVKQAPVRMGKAMPRPAGE